MSTKVRWLVNSLLIFIKPKRPKVVEDENVDATEIRCLKPKAESETIMENTPHYLPGIGVFSILDIINGPTLRGKKHDLSNNNTKLLSSTEKL